jgi:hypothetical protein
VVVRMLAQPCSRGWVLPVSLGNSRAVLLYMYLVFNSDWIFLLILWTVSSWIKVHSGQH